MSVPTLRHGSRGEFVRELQHSLNAKLRPSPNLGVDGVFGPKTQKAVRRYQEANWLAFSMTVPKKRQDGIVGACTWSALKDWDRYVILHRVRLVPQWTDYTCWSASTAMLKGLVMCVDSAGVHGRGGGLLNDSELDDPVNVRRFARFHGLTMLPGQSWTPDGLASLLRSHGPLMINTLWDVDRYVAGRGSSGHMRIIAGIRGDGTPKGTSIRLYDPWPPRVGCIVSYVYDVFMKKVPAATYQVFYR